jgi:hypothetical protein
MTFPSLNLEMKVGVCITCEESKSLPSLVGKVKKNFDPHLYSISYKCASKQAVKIGFSVGIKAKASDFDFQSCLLCANPI